LRENVHDIVLDDDIRDFVGDGLGKFVGETVVAAVGESVLRMCPRL
jgi:hypothetical protein